MIKNLQTKHKKISSLKRIKKTAEINLKHAKILQNASTQDLVQAREHLINSIVNLQKNHQYLLNECKRIEFYGLLHHFGKKAYIKTNDVFVINKLKKYSQALTLVNSTLDARLAKRNIDAVSNIELQIQNLDAAIKNEKNRKSAQNCPEK